MYTVRLESDLGKGLKDTAARHIPFATALALTRVAQSSQKNLRTEMVKVFDRPTQYSLNSLRVQSATKQNLVAAVHLKDEAQGTPSHKFLDPEIEGGRRRSKRFERAFESKGIKPGAQYAMPGKSAQRDAYGNVSGNLIGQVLRQTDATPSEKARKTKARLAKGSKTKRPTGYFVAGKDKRTKHLKPGIYQWQGFAWGRGIKAVFIFTRAPRYRARLPFHRLVDQTIDKELEAQFEAAMAQALSTAR